MTVQQVLPMPPGCMPTRRLTAVELRRLSKQALFAGAEQYLVAFYRRDGAMVLPMQEGKRLMEASGNELHLEADDKITSAGFQERISEILTLVMGGKKTMAITKHAQLKALVMPVEQWINLKQAAGEPVPDWLMRTNA